MTQYSTYTPQQAHDDITALFDAYYGAKKAGDSIPPNKRIECADSIVEHYVEANGKRPPNSVLSRLATYILLDILSDSHPDKMSRDEYPIMSYGQTGRYFERNVGQSPVPYASEDVIGRSKDGDLLRADTDEQRARDWRLFLREVLTDREAFIVEGIYERGETQAEVAAEIGVSRQRVGAIMARVFDTLSENIER